MVSSFDRAIAKLVSASLAAWRNRSPVKREVTSAVLLPAGFVGLSAKGFFLAPTSGYYLIRGNTETNQILLHGIGTAIAESEIVLSRPTLVTVTFDGDVSGRVALQEIRRLLKSFARIRTNGRGIVIKVCVTNVLQEQFFQ